MKKKSSLVIFLLLIGLIFISIRSTSPPAVRSGNAPDTAFSVKRAYVHLSQISRQPHSTGTAGNKMVREYIATVCRQLGYAVEVQSTTSIVNRDGRINAALVNNVIAVKKGSHNSKSVMLMAHYDSEPNTPGAGDNGAGVAAMLETARALDKIKPLQNDLILLFTDGEEIGLMGAHAFAKETGLMKDLGLVINFEGRGNAGASNMIEVNAENGWAINEYSKSAARPFGNSLGYEIYKKLPNATDYTIFKDSGVTGLNNAIIDGFANYHSPNDRPQNMDLRSMQHHGDNMIGLAKHFGNLRITETKAPDVTYFNVTSGWFVHYPASWNWTFLLLTDLLFILFLVLGIKNRYIKIGGSLLGIIVFSVVLACIYFAAKLLLKLMLYCYPLYSHFDQNNSYNSGWYFLAMSALAVTIFSFFYYLVAKRINGNSLLTGILVVVVFLMNVMQYAVPSASYLLFIPVLFILAAKVLVFGKNIKDDPGSAQLNYLNFAGVVPAVLFLSPALYFTFLAFALGSNMPFVVVGIGIFAGLLLPVLYPGLKNQRLLIPCISFICLLGAMLSGHLTSNYSARYPLQSDLFYLMDADSSKAKWHSEFVAADNWTTGFFKSGNSANDFNGYNGGLTNDAPVLPLLPPVAIIVKDTIDNGNRKLLVHFKPSRANVNFMSISIGDSCVVTGISINSQQVDQDMNMKEPRFKSIRYTGVTKNGFDVIFKMEGVTKLDILLNDRSIGLPAITGINTDYPIDIIPTQGANSNTTQVRKHFEF